MSEDAKLLAELHGVERPLQSGLKSEPYPPHEYNQGHASIAWADKDYVEAHRMINSVCRHGMAWPNCTWCHNLEPQMKTLSERVQRIETALDEIKSLLKPSGGPQYRWLP